MTLIVIIYIRVGGQGLLRQTYRRLILFSDGWQRSARFSRQRVFVFHHSDDIGSRIRRLWSFLLFLLCFLGQIEQILKLVGFRSVWVFLTLNIDTLIQRWTKPVCVTYMYIWSYIAGRHNNQGMTGKVCMYTELQWIKGRRGIRKSGCIIITITWLTQRVAGFLKKE